MGECPLKISNTESYGPYGDDDNKTITNYTYQECSKEDCPMWVRTSGGFGDGCGLRLVK